MDNPATIALMLALTAIPTMPTARAQRASPDQIPLLRPNQAQALLYSEVGPAGQASVDAGWITATEHGLDAYEISIGWKHLISPDGSPAFDPWLALIDDLQAGGLQTYFGISTIDTNNLQLPQIFVDPESQRELAPGISFDSPEIVEAFGFMLDALVPELAARDVFYIAIGNEVDIWLSTHPDQIGPYATFVDAARQRIHAIEPNMSVGTVLTSDILLSPKSWTGLFAVSDAIAYTYYHIDQSGTLEPALFSQVLDDLVNLAGEKQILFQEIGIPSGWATGTTISASVERQREFVERLFPAMASHPQIRFWSFLHLGDWSDKTLAIFAEYYGISTPEFIEYLGTLGLYWNDGTPKPAFQEFLRGLNGCPTDLDGNGIVNNTDLTLQIQSPQDLNGDGVINAEDIKCLRRYILGSVKANPPLPFP